MPVAGDRIANLQEAGSTSRSMGYDGLDRLTSANGIWGAGSIGYDALDNLRTMTLGGKVISTVLGASQRVASYTHNGTTTSLGYDANGNLSIKGAQGYSFDIGNRLRSATGKASYGYDGHGRRTLISDQDGRSRLQVYTQDGRLLLTQDSVQGRTEHLYLGSQLIGEVNSASGTSYLHTDALGSPVARTSASRSILSQTRYEPYGGIAAGSAPQVHGYTGHAQDADTGLVYMQQRYYEPLIGRFLSVDPVVADTRTGDLFNRYNYGNNNPYKFKDPNGKVGVLVVAVPPLLIGLGLHYVLPGREGREQSLGRIFSKAEGGDKPASPVLPTGLVGIQDKPSGQQGNRHNSGPLSNEHGGTGDAGKDFEVLTGGKRGDAGNYPGVKGENGVGLRPGKEGEGPRIDIPANGKKPHETLHYPKPKPKSE